MKERKLSFDFKNIKPVEFPIDKEEDEIRNILLEHYYDILNYERQLKFVKNLDMFNEIHSVYCDGVEQIIDKFKNLLKNHKEEK